MICSLQLAPLVIFSISIVSNFHPSGQKPWTCPWLLSLLFHIESVRKFCVFGLQNTSRIWPLCTTSTVIAQTTFIFCLDYLQGLPTGSLLTFSLFSTAARVILLYYKSDHLFKSFPWLLTPLRVKAQVLTMAHKATHYLASDISVPHLLPFPSFSPLQLSGPPGYHRPGICQAGCHLKALALAVPFTWKPSLTYSCSSLHLLKVCAHTSHFQWGLPWPPI